jgi:hypothetical protein
VLLVLLMFVLLLIAIPLLVGYHAFRVWYDEQRELERLAWPGDANAGITPQATNLAVLIHVYGIPRQDVPGDHRDAVRSRFGRSAAALQWSVDRLLEHAAGLRDDAGGGDGGDRGEGIARRLRAAYPEMTADAADALAAWAASRRPDAGPSSGWTPL